MASPRITVSCPASPDFLRLARMATADAGSRVGFDYEEIDDLRIAISELCVLISGGGGGVLTLEFVLEGDALTVIGDATPGVLVDNELSHAIVRAVVDDFELTASNGSSRFRASKRSAVR